VCGCLVMSSNIVHVRPQERRVSERSTLSITSWWSEARASLLLRPRASTWTWVCTDDGDVSHAKPQRSLSEPRCLTTHPQHGMPHSIAYVWDSKAAALTRAAAAEVQDARIAPWALVLWVFFGASGWWSCNAVFSEMPLYVAQLPEGKRIGNLLEFMTQLGNVVLVGYKLLDNFVLVEVRWIIEFMMALAVAALLLNAVVWNELVGGGSFFLLLVAFITGSAGSMSNATYWAFMMRYPPICTKAVSFGMSMGGVVTMLIAVVQLSGRSGSPLFGVGTFFVLTGFLQMVWWAIFLHLQGRLSTFTRALLCCKGGAPTHSTTDKDGTLSPIMSTTDFDVEETENVQLVPRTWKVRCAVYFLYALSYGAHALTYTLPTVFPFVAGAYLPGQRQEILIWMQLMQQIGESIGRLLAPHRGMRACLLAVLVTTPALVVIASIFGGMALRPAELAALLPYGNAQIAIPGMCLVYQTAYGIIQTVIFMWPRALVDDVREAEQIASNMGFLGQMGAFSVNVVLCLAVNL